MAVSDFIGGARKTIKKFFNSGKTNNKRKMHKKRNTYKKRNTHISVR